MLKCYVRGDPPAVFPKKRSVLLLAAVVLLVCCCLFVPAAAAEGTGTQDDPIVVPEYGYVFSSGSITGINATWLSTLPAGGENVWLKLEIPNKINDQEVKSIKSSAFKASAGVYKIASVDMSKASSLLSIGNDAFRGNSQITSLTLPDSLTSIGTYAFYQCTGITSLTLPDSLTKIERNAFRDCSGITGEITIPAGIKNLENNVFYGCSKLTGVYLPSQLTTIGESVFAGCSGLKFIRVAGQDASAGNFILPPDLTRMGSQAFMGCSGIVGEVTIPEGVTTLERNVFKECSGLTGVYLSTGLKQIGTSDGGSVFYGCTGLQFIRVNGDDEYDGNFTLPDTLTTIGKHSFYKCFADSVSTSVTIPKSVDYIGSEAFHYSNAITTIFIERKLANSRDNGYDNYDTYAFKASNYGPGKRLTIFPDSMYGWKDFPLTGDYGDSLTYPLTLKFSGAGKYNHLILYKQPIYYAYNEVTGEWEFDMEYELPPVPDQGDTPRPGHTYGWAYGSGATAELLHINWKYTRAALVPSVTVEPKDVLAPPTIQPSIDGVALSQSGPSFHLTVSGGQDVGVSVTHPLAGEGDADGYVYFKYEWTDVQDSTDGPRMSAEKDLFGKEQDEPSIPIRDPADARYETGDFYYVEVYAYYHDHSTGKDTLYYKSHDAVIYFGSDQDTKATVSTVYRLYVTVADPVVIEPVNLTIYANEKFPSPLYSGIPENAVIEANGQTYPVDKPPFDIAYYNTTTNTQIFKPDTPGIYNATIQPASSVQLAQITINGNPVTFRNGTLTVRQITDANETIPVTQQTLQNDGISVSVPAGTTYYLNDNTSLPEVSAEKIHLLHDAILAGGEETLKRIAPEYFDDSSKYEMKYFDLIDTGNGHTWVSSSKDVTITWPYPEGTDENTEFTLLHYLDLHREYFTDADLNSKTEPVTVSKTGSGVQFSIPQSGFSPFALIWSDAVTHTVTFETYDGSQTQKVVKDGEPLSRPADPVREGYTFTGWYTDQDCNNPWDFNTPVTEDMTLYAGWKQNNPPSGGGSSDGNMDNAFRVLFNDGATTLFVVTDLSYGDKLTKPEDPVKDGYTFAGWHKDAACTQAWDFADGITGDMTLYAKWTPVQTVTPTVTPTATVSVTPTVTAEPTGLPTTTPTVQPTDDNDGGKPAGSVLPLIGGILILILAVLLLLFLLLRHTVTFLIPTGGEITEHRIKVWHGRYIDPADLPELLRTAAWYRDPARRERWDFDEDRVTKSIELYLG